VDGRKPHPDGVGLRPQACGVAALERAGTVKGTNEHILTPSLRSSVAVSLLRPLTALLCLFKKLPVGSFGGFGIPSPPTRYDGVFLFKRYTFLI